MIDVGKLDLLKVNRAGIIEIGETLYGLENNLGEGPAGSCIGQKVRVPLEYVDRAIAFWKPIYFDMTTEGRHLNGVEAFQLGDEKLHDKPNKAPYIAMCNLMALEAILRLGDYWPTAETPEKMIFGSEREREISNFWKKTFAPTEFQVNWAWAAAMAVLAGDPAATNEMIYSYKDQLP